MMRAAMAAVAAVFLAGPASAGDPPTPFQEIQLVQSALDLLGYDPGVIDGRWGARTAAAVDAFVADAGFEGATDGADGALIEALLSRLGPALAQRFGTDPTGSWDLDVSAMPEQERQDLMAVYGIDSLETCSSPFAIYFSTIAYRQWMSGVPLVMQVSDGRMEALAPSSEGLEVPFAFVYVDDRNLHRLVEGTTEVWVRCDEPAGTPDAASE